ncbi:hypothetical protein CR207_05105 [Chromobacterium violaceum]|uniref:hypothetical protein n=1 Tax=Chromobacterium violaceum TaxID=536 RepID=UPI0009DB2E10|nr:hypothetical protein [Chromobacterium violaceum]ATP27826.1 hypothetical protein CRN81_05095 [Chromobacterium violaceum]ATP31738.1 hypothetical protein CR207_05105 [Chromobacterium violaceum]MBP4050939.1 hypothetical protein [Chromobacterium violaceum]OQS21622.1 hypothetical protein B0T41_20440 [Chromobacterium violaceum]
MLAAEYRQALRQQAWAWMPGIGYLLFQILMLLPDAHRGEDGPGCGNPQLGGLLLLGLLALPIAGWNAKRLSRLGWKRGQDDSPAARLARARHWFNLALSAPGLIFGLYIVFAILSAPWR